MMHSSRQVRRGAQKADPEPPGSCIPGLKEQSSGWNLTSLKPSPFHPRTMCGSEPIPPEMVVESVTVEAWTWEVRTADSCPNRLDSDSFLGGAIPRAAIPATKSHPLADSAIHAVGKKVSEMPWARAAQGPTLPVLTCSAGVSRPLNSRGEPWSDKPEQMPPPRRLQQSLERVTQRAGTGIPSQPNLHESHGLHHAAAEDLPSPSSLYHAYLDMVSKNLPVMAARRLRAASTTAGLLSPLQRDKQRRELTSSRTQYIEPRPRPKASDGHARLRALALAHTTGGCREPEEDGEPEGGDELAARDKRSYSELLQRRSFCGDLQSAFAQPFRKRARTDPVESTSPSLPALWQSGSLLRGCPAYLQAWEETAWEDASAGFAGTTSLAETLAAKRTRSDSPAHARTYSEQLSGHSHSLGPTSHCDLDNSSCRGELSRTIFPHHLARYGSGPAALAADFRPRTSTSQAPSSSCLEPWASRHSPLHMSPPHGREGRAECEATITATSKASEGLSRAVEGTGVYVSQMERIRMALLSCDKWEGKEEAQKQHLQRWQQRQQQQSRQQRKQTREVEEEKEEEAQGSDEAGLEDSEDGELANLEQDLLLEIEEDWRKESMRCKGQAGACNTKDAVQVEGSQGTQLLPSHCSDTGWDNGILHESQCCIFPSCPRERPSCPCEHPVSSKVLAASPSLAEVPDSCSPLGKRGIDADLNEYPMV